MESIFEIYRNLLPDEVKVLTFGDTPSISEVERMSIKMHEDLKNDEVLILVSIDNEPFCKINTSNLEVNYSVNSEKKIDELAKENLFFLRASGMKNIMTNPRGKTNMDKYLDAVKSLKEKEVKLSECSEKAVKTKEKLENEIKVLKNSLILLEELKDKIEISETAKKEITKLWIENKLGRKRTVETEATKKGTVQEDESIKILSIFDGKDYVKNEDRLIDFDYRLSGELDIEFTHEDGTIEVIDVKSRYDAESFYNQDDEEQNKGEAEQLDAYFILKPNAEIATIANVLVNDTDDAIRKKIYIKSLSFENGEMPKAHEIKIIKEQCFDYINFKRLVNEICGDISNDADALDEYDSFREIPISMRVIKISRYRDEERLDLMKQKINKSLAYAREKYKVK